MRYELRRREPLLEVRFFPSAPFAGASAIAVCLFAAIGGFLFLNTLYLQDVRGLSPLHAGLYMLPMAAVMIVFAPLSGRLVGPLRRPPADGGRRHRGARQRPAADRPDAEHVGRRSCFVAYAVFGIGSGLVNPPITNTAVSGMPPAQAGVAAAVATTSRQVGITLGVAVLGAVAGGGLAAALGPGFAEAMRPAWWIVAVLGLIVAVLGYLSTTGWARTTALRTAERLEEPEVRDFEPCRTAVGAPGPTS